MVCDDTDVKSNLWKMCWMQDFEVQSWISFSY